MLIKLRGVLMKKLFSNFILIRTNQTDLEQLLLNAFELSKWNYAISNIEKIKPQTYAIQRNQPAANQAEEVRVFKEDDRVIYDSTGGRIKYRLEFSFLENLEKIELRENFFVTSDTLIFPETLFTPIIKHAFNQNLQALKRLAE